MFARIYLGLVTTILLSLVLSYFVFAIVNETRERQYNEAVYSGTFKLIRSGLRRHEGSKRDEWLSIVRRLSGIDLRLISSDAFLSGSHAGSDDVALDEIRFEDVDDSESYRVTLRVDPQQFLIATIESISEQQLRVALLLGLNELEGASSTNLPSEIAALQTYFAHPLALVKRTEVPLDSTQTKRLNSGAIVVVLSKDEHASESHSVYGTLTKGSEEVLVLGPIPNFVATPISLLSFLVALNILLIGVAAYFMVRRLEKRLQAMSVLVSDFGRGQFDHRLPASVSVDSVSVLGDSFNAMADRITELIEDQKHMSQAISHELRTPIARMKFRLDILAGQVSDERDDSDPALEKIQGLKRDLTELNNLVDEALFFQQVESMSSLVNETMETVLVHACVHEIDMNLQSLFPGKSLKLEMDEASRVQANAVFLRRLLQNLISNGLRHAHAQVLVSYRQQGSYHELVVEDDGEGIPSELRETLFQPFQRAENSRNKKFGGYGLGLAIVRRIAELHQGSITLDDSSMGGAKFSFTWPTKGA